MNLSIHISSTEVLLVYQLYLVITLKYSEDFRLREDMIVVPITYTIYLNNKGWSIILLIPEFGGNLSFLIH